ncbi:lysine-specific demethylase 7A [Xenopus tropicalis]|uniref:Lysine-specific demethylase 7A n=1 Tax=Xenopus tropicalis TaxID=8364 RepID=KDM7A_XENTR|nr:lysine-specific demethylase 7A [Xenopus tropicalis]Q08D35.1 RecName: Full=Lysine-specific demethylase 7A; AltName: Full=JmjC domain-containing histone demethylation protein 1D; AltName: Full=Lysine-specific demethylase 7 [Xenopus tropicalis]AAI23961.1 jumonji C domain containing histone demethylase 1 homolog D [Xenopus tropicalis]|eukprot:NP_001072664.1 lysine-specific demethylase 7A [Xenopus tropicalis]
MAGAAPVYCVCRQPYDVSRFMIECDICKDWFHSSCVKVEEHQAADIDLYHCPNCEVLHGPSQLKKRRNWHRHDYTEPDDGTKPVQAGTRTFIQQLQARSFPSADDLLLKMNGSQLTQRYLEKQGFNLPIMVPRLDDLGLRLPPPTFSVMDVERYVGGEKIIDVIDVARQADSKMKLKNFVKYFMNPDRPKVLNVISLEFSDTKMADLVKVPDISKKLSWVENYWPDDSFFTKPFVQKYCLMGVQDSYTDFHIDFGGTSVWYHVLWGEKVFYLIKPSDENLALYESWSSSVTQSEEFFGDKVDKCYKCVVKQGHTLFVPTGWIHAVLTSQDCMAFGGNFLHNLNIGMQLRCYEMEKRLKTPDLFKFPFFEAICWFVAKNLLETLKELKEDGFHPPNYLKHGVKALISALKSWMKKESVAEHAFEIPDNIRPGHLIKELSKVIRSVEEEGNRPVKSQGIHGHCPVSRSSHEKSSHHSGRKARRLRDHSTKTPTNLDILEHHTREVLKRLEMSPWEEDAGTYKLNMRFNKPLLPSSTEPDQKVRDNGIRLLLSNGRIIRDERQPFTDRSLYTADSEDEDDRARSRKAKDIKQEKPCSTSGMEDKAETQKPLNMFFESVKSELRNGSSEYSDISDSEGSEDNCTNQKHFSEESESSGDDDDEEEEEEEERQEPIRNLKEEHSGRRLPCDPNFPWPDHDSPQKRECPTSTSMEQEAVQGMLSMASLHYPSALPTPAKSTDCNIRGGYPQLHIRVSQGNGKEHLDSHSHKAANSDHHVKDEGEFSALDWIRQPDASCRLSPQDSCQVPQSLRREFAHEEYEKAPEDKHYLEIEHWDSAEYQPEKYDPESSMSSGECHLSDGSLSPTRIYGDTAAAVPLHPTKRPASNPPPISNQATKGKRPKKGMATAKQRLGKILKLNRNGHARFFV